MSRESYPVLAAELKDLLGLGAEPIAITFVTGAPPSVPRFDAAMPAPAADGRTGTVAAGCVFWMRATEREFATTDADHANCSVGSLTHGFKTRDDVSGAADIAALVEAEWVPPDALAMIPTVRERPNAIVYAPLKSASLEADVVFLRLNGKQLMMLHEAAPDLRFEGKPQCHIIPIAKESGSVAVSTGCMLSRIRTGMSNNEVTCAIPASLLGAVVGRLKSVQRADLRVATYASADAKRFPSAPLDRTRQ
jgi:uncharacterized protein (DUF169 family)